MYFSTIIFLIFALDNNLFNMKVKSVLTKSLAGFSLLLMSMSVQAEKILVSSTDFSIPDREDEYYSSFDDLKSADTYGGVIIPIINPGAGYSLSESTASGSGMTVGQYSEDAFSDFLQGMHYAIVNNPIKLDTNRLYDNKENYWGAIFSLGEKMYAGNPGQELLSYELSGLKNNGEYSVEIEYFNPLSQDYLNVNSDLNKSSRAKGGPYLSTGYNAALKVGINTKDGTYIGNPGQKSGSVNSSTITYSIPNSDLGPIVDGNLSIHLYANMYNGYEAIGIKSIKVYAEVDPKIFSYSENTIGVGGESIKLELSSNLSNCDIQWYKNGRPISGANGTSYIHTSGMKEETSTYHVVYTTSLGDRIQSASYVVKDKISCLDEAGNPMSRKLIWQDDFGTFTEKGKYWVWDYSDINEPKKINKETAFGWQYALDYDIPGAKFVDNDEYFRVGSYTVAGNVTCQWDDLSGGDGTQWGWLANCFNGQRPSNNGWKFVPDHTYKGSAWGGMFFLDSGNEPGEVIYSRTIEGLGENYYTVKCYINNFSDASIPVVLKIRVTDMNTGKVVESQSVTRYAVGAGASGVDWEEVSVDISLTGSALKFEIISEVGGTKDNMYGNDLILDDIQVWTCVPMEAETPVAKDPVIKGSNNVCVGGESVKLSVDLSDYKDCSVQWYKNGSPIAGATNNAYLYTSGFEVTSNSLQVKVTIPDGKTVSSNNFVVNDIVCSVDDAGFPVSQKLVWQDDFGTFTSKGNYWVWDYTDLSNPKKVQKTTNAANRWGYELDYEIPGAKFNEKENDFTEGSYIVAANVTCKYDDISEGEGTQWGWPAYCFNGFNPGKNGWKFVPDHTYNGSAWGGMLFLNCGNEAETPIYSRTIEGLCYKNYTLKCYINTFSNGEIPVKVKLRMTDINTGNIEESAVVERSTMNSGVDWFELSCSINLTGSTLKFEIIDVDGSSNRGNDLILDDIQLWTASFPGVLLYFDPITLAEDTTVAGSDIVLYANETPMMDVFYNGEQHFLYQWNKGPVQDDSQWNMSWKNIGSATQNAEYKVDINEMLAGETLSGGDEILFRVISADARVLRNVMYFNPNESCGAYSVSNLVSMKISQLTGLDNAESSDVRVVSLDNATVQVQNADANAKVVLYNVCGMCLATVTADEDGMATVSLPQSSGVYVISVVGNSFKVVR